MQLTAGPAAVSLGIVCFGAAILPWWQGVRDPRPSNCLAFKHTRATADTRAEPATSPAWRNCRKVPANCTIEEATPSGAAAATQRAHAAQSPELPVTQVPLSREIIPREITSGEILSGENSPAAVDVRRLLVRSGRLVFDANRLSRVHSRFAGHIVSIGQTEPSDSTDAPRALRYGDTVQKGQLLAVVWSRELAEKKSELLSALAQLQLEAEQAGRLAAAPHGTQVERLKSEHEQRLKAAGLTAARVERTLHSWHIGDDEIEEIRAEARHLAPGRRADYAARARGWAEVQIRSPIDGLVLERNVSVGETVDQQHALFKIADVSTLGVTIDVYEEDLPALESLEPQARRWTVRLNSEPSMTPIAGSFDVIAHVVDPRSHTIPVLGSIDNSQGLLRAGQFVTAEIPLH